RAHADQPQRPRTLRCRPRDRRRLAARVRRHALGLRPRQPQATPMSFDARRMTPAALVLTLLLAVPACNRSPEPDADAPPPASTARSQDPAANRIEADVRALADDRMQGRETGTPGHDLAADYVAARFAEAGLVPGGEDGGWFQRVPLLRATIAARGARLDVHLDGQSRSLAFQDEFLPM